MDFFLQKLASANNIEILENEEEEEFDDYEFIETLHGLSKKLPAFLGLSDQLMDQMLEFYFYDITKIGKLFANDDTKIKLLNKFGATLDNCSEKLYLMPAQKEEILYTCRNCQKRVEGRNILALVCSHFFCRDCWISNVQKGDLKCIEAGCNCRMPFIDAHDLYPEIDPDKFKSMIQVLTQLDYQIQLLNKGDDYIKCSNCSEKYDFNYARFGCILCRKCKKTFCLKCRKEAHLPLSCDESEKFNSLINKYSNMPKELNQYKQYHSCKARLNQQKKEIQHIIRYSLKNDSEISDKVNEVLNQNMLNIRKIYESIKNISNNDDFSTFELLNDQEFFNSNDTKLFQEKYPSHFNHFSNAYQTIIKNEEESKAFFGSISDKIHDFESDPLLESCLNDLAIIFDYSPPHSEITYEDEPDFLDIEISSDHDDIKEIHKQSSDNDEDTNDDSDHNSTNLPYKESQIENANHNENSNNNNNGNTNEYSINNNNNSNENYNNNDNDNTNENSNNNDGTIEKQNIVLIKTEEELRRKDEEVQRFVEEMHLRKKPQTDNPYKEALDAYMKFVKEGNFNSMNGIEYKIEDDENAVEYSINKHFVRMIKANTKAFLHFNKKNKNFDYLLMLVENIENFLFQSTEHFKYDLSYYLILLRYFSCGRLNNNNNQ